MRECKGECKGRCKRVQGRGCKKGVLRKGVCGAVALAHSSGKMDCSRCSRSTLSLSSPCSSSSAYLPRVKRTDVMGCHALRAPRDALPFGC